MMYLGKDPVAIAKETGARFEKGSFTTGTTNPYTLNYQNSFAKYLIYIEMSDESKTALITAAVDATRAYAFMAKYPIPSIDGGNPNNVLLNIRYNPVAKMFSYNYCSVASIDANHITIYNEGTQNNFIKGYTYNYYIVEIK